MYKCVLFNKIKLRRHNKLLLCFIVLSCSNINASTFCVNDYSTKGDIFTTAVGNNSNDGTSPDKPKSNIFSAYTLAKNDDIIIVDVGNYTEISTKVELLFEKQKKLVLQVFQILFIPKIISHK